MVDTGWLDKQWRETEVWLIVTGQIGTSWVVQWLRIHLATQGTRVRSLVRELRSHMPRGN